MLATFLAIAFADVPPPPGPARPPRPPTALETRCSSTIDARAMLGKLTPGDAECLRGVAATPGDPDRAAASEALLQDALSRGDRDVWRTLAEAHLVFAPTADVAWRLAVDRKQHDDPSGVLRWTEVTLDHHGDWTGPTWAKRVDGTLELRADATGAVWRESGAEADRLATIDAAARRVDFTASYLPERAVAALASCLEIADDAACHAVPHGLAAPPAE